MYRAALATLILAAAACSESPPAATTAASTAPRPATTSLSRPPFCTGRLPGELVGEVASVELNEISGAAFSRSRPGVLWVHNDSGSDAEVFAISDTGQDLGRVSLPDLSARDWEDMAIGPGPNPATDYLYFADIGDNNTVREEVLIHRVPEPEAGVSVVSGGETLRFTYPTGPVEAETLLVDPASGDMIIASKALSGRTRLFSLSGDLDWNSQHAATFVGEVPLGTFAVATGGDADAGQIVIRTYDEVFRWERPPDHTLAEVLLTPGCRVASVDEGQGEAIALIPDRAGFFTVSEGLHQPLWRFVDGG